MAEQSLSKILEETFVRCRDMEVPLADRLQAFANEVRRMGPHFQTAVDSLVERLMENGAGATAPKVGEAMPPFVLPDENGRLVSLQDLLQAGPVAIAFHRGYWCPYCRININALARAEKEIAVEQRHVAAIVPDRQRFTSWLKTDAEAPFPILTDMDNGYAMSLDLAIWVGDEMKELMVGSGWDPIRLAGNRRLGAADSGHFHRRHGRQSHGALRRSGLPHADGDRGHGRRAPIDGLDRRQ